MNIARLLARSSWRFYRHHPAQLLLSIIGIVLGVAIVTAVLITNDSSQRAFALSSEALYGRTTHQLSGALGIEQERYVELRKRFSDLSMAPVIEGQVAIGDEVFSILGLDPFSEAAFNRTQMTMQNFTNTSLASSETRSGSAPSSGSGMVTKSDSETTSATSLNGATIRAFIQQPDALLVSEGSVAERDWQIGQKIDLKVGGRVREATLAATFRSANPAASTGLLIGDIGFVQTLLQRGERIDRIDLILNENQLQRLTQWLPATLQLSPAISRQQTMQAMTRGFHINLTAMSLLALVVGIFLIHNTMTFAVVQRREIFAIKRITGITTNTLLLSILSEALIISLIGSLIGVALGYAVAHILIGLTTQTINDLYFVLHIQKVWFSPWLIVAGLVLGVGSSLLATSLSAFDAASTSPVLARQRSVIEQRSNRVLPRCAGSGLLIMLAGGGLALLPLQSLLIGFGALMMLILGYGMVLPWMVKRAAQLLQPLVAPFGVSASLAVAGIERNISRTGLAIAALSIAVSATFGVEIMIGSFRSTVDAWLSSTLQSDIYISAPSNVNNQAATGLTEEIVNFTRSIAGVASVSTSRTLTATTSVGQIDMLVVEPHQQSDGRFELLSTLAQGSKPAWQAWSNSDSLMISEPLATRHQLSVGDTLQLFTQTQGMLTFSIVAVFRDFESSHGKILLSRNTYARYWNDPQVNTLGILLTAQTGTRQTISQPSAVNSLVDIADSAIGGTTETVTTQQSTLNSDTTNKHEQAQYMMQILREKLSSPEQPLLIRSNTAIHEQSLAVFDRTFEVTRVLRWLTVAVAFVGIFSALLALNLERAREFAIIRATGATRQQLMTVVLLQTFCMGLLAGILALPLGWLMSEVLIKVINVRSFGWSMQSLLPSNSIRDTVILACLSAVLAGLYPAWRLSRARIAEQLRND